MTPLSYLSTAFRKHLLVPCILLAGVGSLVAAPTLVSVVPGDGATGVSVSTPLVCRFSEAMSTQMTFALFTDGVNQLTAIPTWSSGNTVVTFTPYPSWPAGATISWDFMVAYSAVGIAVDPLPSGSFSTSGGGPTGSGTNAITALSLGRLMTYNQYSPAAPTLDTLAPYYFVGSVTLASNRTATNITLAMPTGSVSNLNPTWSRPEFYSLAYFDTNQATFDGLYPSGDYTFTIKSTASNQVVTFPLPPSMAQPGAPHITSFTAAQGVDASQPFTISWDPFTGGGSTDYVQVTVGDWRSPDPLTAGALNGLSTSVQVPANTLQPSWSYEAFVSFYRFVGTSNVTYTTAAYKTTATRFNVSTIGLASRPALGNWVKTAGSFAFDVSFTAGQAVTVVSSTNAAAPLAQWQVLLTTNAPGTTFRFTDPRVSTNKSLYYRARNGS